MSIRRTVVVVAGFAALSVGATAVAGITGKVLDDLRSRPAESSSSQPAPAPPPPARPSPRRSEDSGRSRPPPAPVESAPAPAPRERGSRGSRPPADDVDMSNAGSPRDRNRNSYSRPPKMVPSLPEGHHHYDWDGRRYYRHGRDWYQPYGSSFISIGVPYGLFVSTLPGYSTSFWFGSTRYYYYDDLYYTYEPVRRGYVVARSPYGDDDRTEDEAEVRDDDLYIYPAKGQSEQQQADDRYACHRWAVRETGYDPLDDEYVRASRDNYQRALTACLTGRGYSVR